MDASPEVAANACQPPPLPGTESRSGADRRQTPTSPWGAFPPAGRRMRNRRAGERKRPYFVDRFPPWMLALLLLLVTGSLIDAALTIRLLQAGAEEINPLMDCLLGYGIVPFFLGKYLLTVAGFPLLVVFKNQYLFGSRFRVGYLIPATVLLYLVLIAYQLALLFT